VIKAKIKAKGIIEKPDIIGAVFGQTEGLLGSDLDLRELQRTGRIGRIEVNIKTEKGKSEGDIIIPSSLDSAETALIGATLETIERIGPCTAEITLLEVEDTRADKRKYVVDRSKEILQKMTEMGVPDSGEISEQIKEAVRTSEVSLWHGLSCGPNLQDSEELIIVEGRADVINLLKFGIRNTIAVEGTSVPPIIKELTREKTVTVFVDGDRGGQLIAKELVSMAQIDFIAMAPEGKEVEELSKKEVYKALREKSTADNFFKELKGGKKTLPEKKRERSVEQDKPVPERSRGPVRDRPSRPGRPGMDRMDRRGRDRPGMDRRGRDRPGRPGRDRPGRGGPQRRPFEGASRQPRIRLSKSETDLYRKTLEDLVGTRAACIFNDKNEVLGRVPVSELEGSLRGMENPYAVVLDGKVDAGLNDVARRKGVKLIIGMEKENFFTSISVLERKDLK
jgi:5S rRNA maturation endonuclease (ribonuclease M5)